MITQLPPALLGDALPTPVEMAEWDAASIREFCIPETMLMENAAREAFHAINSILRGSGRGSHILVVMGGGNNGGDGACLARHLNDTGHTVLVLHTAPLEKLKDTAKTHVEIAKKTGVLFTPLSPGAGGFHIPPEFSKQEMPPAMVIDALLGTGFTGELREKELVVIRRINMYCGVCPIISLDVPSGLDALSGHPSPEAVRADMTVTFEAAKTGLAFPHAKEYTGTLAICPIGIPKAARDLHPASFYRLSPAPEAWPASSPFMHKGTAGRVLILGGSTGMAGAPALAALGALRNGAGLVTIACPGGVEPQVRSGYPEIMTAPLGQAAAWSPALISDCLHLFHGLPHSSALVVGPGMGKSLQEKELVAALIAEKQRPSLVLDADGLAALNVSDTPEALSALREDDCITPHPGEAARILNTTTEDVQAARVKALRALTSATRATVVLKGAGTLIGREKFPIFIAPFATPSLAVGGSGDVLSGVIAAFMAQMRSHYPYTFYFHDAFHAIALGVFVHGKAGQILDETYPHRGALAREIADTIPRVPRV
jgi:NAD(P)H-hydrate epimerase